MCEKKYDWETFEFCCLSASKYCLWPNGSSILDLIDGSFTHGLSFGGYRGRQISTLIIQLHKVGYKERANRVHISCDIVWLFWQFDILYCKKTCLSSRLSALRFSTAFLFPPYEKWAERQQKKKQSYSYNLSDVLVCSISEYFYCTTRTWHF